MPLKEAEIRAFGAMTKPVKKADGAGLYLEVFPNGSKLWRLRFRIGGKEKRLTLGSCPAVSLAVRYLQLGPLAGDHLQVLASVELERLLRHEHKRHESAPATGLGIALTVDLPLPGEGSDAVVGTVIAQHDQIGVHLLDRAPLLA